MVETIESLCIVCRVLERAFKLYLIRDKKNRSDERVDLTITGDCGNKPLSVDKLIR